MQPGVPNESTQARGSSLRPKAQSIELWLPNARLFLDDIEAIYGLLSELGQVEIETNLYKLESLDAFKELPADEEVDVTLRVREPNEVTVYLERRLGLVSSWRASLAVRGVAPQIAARVRQRRGWWDWLLQGWVPYAALALIFGPFAASFLPGSAAGSIERWVEGGIAFLGVALIAGGRLRQATARHISVVPVRRRDAPSFWTRNRDAVVVGLVVGIVAAIVGALAGVLLSRH